MAFKLAYITAMWPYGRAEGFLHEDVSALQRSGLEITVFPRNPRGRIDNPELKVMAAITASQLLPTFGQASLLLNGRRRELSRTLYSVIRHSPDGRTRLKNILAWLRGIVTAPVLVERCVRHIHAHWGTTTATLAYVASRCSGIPWSLTLHRHDIRAGNMLYEKVREARFVRCISNSGREAVLKATRGDFAEKLIVLHMGVMRQLISDEPPSGRTRAFTMVTPANLLPVKGHRYLVDACASLRRRSASPFQCFFFGEGPLRKDLGAYIRSLGLQDVVHLAGHLPRGELIRKYQSGDVDLVVLPSIVTEDGHHEGIPVSLMEAMACGVPVLSTRTGGIPELLEGGAGLLVEEKNPLQLADSIALLMSGQTEHNQLAERGRQAVAERFDADSIAQTLSRLFRAHSA